jgi:hypothetical protein
MNVSRLDTRHPVFWVYRLGAVAVALVLFAFAALGFASGTGFVTVHGAHALGMTGNGLLSTISVIVGAILVFAAVRGGPAASTTCAVIGGLFVLSGLANLALVDGPYNFLAFTLPNIMFSFVVGIILLFVGLYGRASGRLPADNPYRQARGGDTGMTRLWHGESVTQENPEDPETAAQKLEEISELAEAEHAMAEGEATPRQERQVLADATERSSRRRTRAWRRAERDGWRGA